MLDPEVAQFKSWAILELMGHRRLAGLLQEQQIGGASFLRLDIPGEQGFLATQYYSPAAVYAITPCDEDTARLVARDTGYEPVSKWEVRRMLEPAGSPETRHEAAAMDDDDGYPFEDEGFETCACRYCHCAWEVADGGVCSECAQGAHQG